MARKIKLDFYNKQFVIEYANRSEVKEYFANLKQYKKNIDKIINDKNISEKETIETGYGALRILIKAGLVEHHANEMPSDSDIDRWISSMPNAKQFFEKLISMIQEVMSEIGEDRKNIKWEVEDN